MTRLHGKVGEALSIRQGRDGRWLWLTFRRTCEIILFVLCMSSLLGTLQMRGLLCSDGTGGRLETMLGAGTGFISGSRSFCSLRNALWTL